MVAARRLFDGMPRRHPRASFGVHSKLWHMQKPSKRAAGLWWNSYEYCVRKGPEGPELWSARMRACWVWPRCDLSTGIVHKQRNMEDGDTVWFGRGTDTARGKGPRRDRFGHGSAQT